MTPTAATAWRQIRNQLKEPEDTTSRKMDPAGVGQQGEMYLSAPTSRITAFAPGVGSSGQAAAGMPQLEQLEPENADDARANAERHVGGV